MILETHTVHELRKAVGYKSCKYMYLLKEVIIPFVRLLIVISPNGDPGPQPTSAASAATSSEPDL